MYIIPERKHMPPGNWNDSAFQKKKKKKKKKRKKKVGTDNFMVWHSFIKLWIYFPALATLKPQAGITAVGAAGVPAAAQPVSNLATDLADVALNEK